jgi:hypothetical protein
MLRATPGWRRIWPFRSSVMIVWWTDGRALSEDPRPGPERKLGGKEEALLVATACANPPKGRAR